MGQLGGNRKVYRWKYVKEKLEIFDVGTDMGGIKSGQLLLPCSDGVSLGQHHIVSVHWMKFKRLCGRKII